MTEPREPQSSDRRRALLRRLLFPTFLVLSAAVAFAALGPASSPPTDAQRLVALAPPGAGAGPFAARSDASPTEQEIAKRYETVRQYPDTVDAYVLLGNAYLQHVREKGDPADYGRADAAFGEALRRDPDNLNALIGRGVLSLARHEFRSALEFGRQAVEISPQTARAHGVIVDALTELGRYEEAVICTQRMVDLRPDLASLSRVAYQRELHGDVDGAIEAMSRAFDASVGSPVENREYIRVLIGDLHLLKGDLETAERTYRASLASSPGLVWALVGLARVDAATGDFDAAVAGYESAVSMLPLPEFLIPLADVQQAAGRELDAARTRQLVRAEQTLFAAGGVNVDLELAIFEADHGDPAAAVEIARRAYADQPNVKAADAFGWALHRAGQSAEGRAYLDEALRLGTASPQFQFHAGMIALELGDTSMARDHLAQALVGAGALSPLDAALAREVLDGLGS